ncbi:hypothetical protein [Mesomycoplasma lagogenitalium]|uniref:PQ loop repeat n=1 Tax=Mesomycoplasma lagogenitalium TaxID=171286 RepID=A0ABY8LUL3_9BACT|nr:hypothetical protein [Mesomycoplasma lagogenitalium]WGI36390.1 hypothetical protein QEG99_02865 [Mesomycoplasma lagogenitalium]
MTIEIFFKYFFAIIALLFSISYATIYIVKTYKEKNHKVDLTNYFILYFALFFWTLYGTYSYEREIIITISGILLLIFLSIIISLLLKYKKSRWFSIFIFLTTIFIITLIVVYALSFANNWTSFNWLVIVYGFLAINMTYIIFWKKIYNLIKVKKIENILFINLIIQFIINTFWTLYWLILFSISLNLSFDFFYILIIQILTMIIYISLLTYRIYNWKNKGNLIKNKN